MSPESLKDLRNERIDKMFLFYGENPSPWTDVEAVNELWEEDLKNDLLLEGYDKVESLIEEQPTYPRMMEWNKHTKTYLIDKNKLLGVVKS